MAQLSYQQLRIQSQAIPGSLMTLPAQTVRERQLACLASFVSGQTINGVERNLTTSDFEDGTVQGWVSSGGAPPTIANSTLQAHGGTHSLSLTGTGTANGTVIKTAVPLTAGTTTYHFSSWVYLTVSRVCYMQFGFFDAGANFIPPLYATPVIAQPATTWIPFSLTMTAPAAAVTMNIQPIVVAGQVGEVYYVDDITLNGVTFT